jgi:hypothetical protein
MPERSVLKEIYQHIMTVKKHSMYTFAGVVGAND